VTPPRRPRTVTVTTEHIIRGELDSVRRSPVTLALHDAFPAATEIVAGSTTFSVIQDTPPAGLLRGVFPPEAAAFINALDLGYAVAMPFTFSIDGRAVGGMTVFPGSPCGHAIRPWMNVRGPCNRPSGHAGKHLRITAHGLPGYTLGCRCTTCRDGWRTYERGRGRVHAGRDDQQ
jgi:hypothetical protein